MYRLLLLLLNQLLIRNSTSTPTFTFPPERSYVREITDSFLNYVIYLNLAIESIIVALLVDVQITAFSLDYFFNPEFFFGSLFATFFLKCSNSFFTIEITNNICAWYSIFYFFDQKDVLRPICKNILGILKFLHDQHLEFRSFVIMLETIAYIRTLLNMVRFHYDYSMICVVVFVNYFI